MESKKWLTIIGKVQVKKS